MAKKICMAVKNTFTHDARVLREAQSLVRTGFAVTVYALAGKNLPSEEKLSGFTVKRHSALRLEGLAGEKADVYHAHDADTLLVSYLAARKNRAKLVYDFHEYWRKKTLWRRSLPGKIWDRFENYFLVLVENLVAPHADAVLTVNESLAKEFGSCHLLKREPIFLYNVPDLTVSTNSDHQILRQKIKAANQDKLIIFLGSLISHRGLENLIKSLEYLPREFKLVFLGYGDLKEKLLAMAQTFGYGKRIFILDPVGPGQVARWASGADVGMAPIQNVSWSYYHSLPNKIFEYLMAGLPIAASDFPEIKKIVVGEGIGVCFDPEDPEDISRAIKKILLSEVGYKKMKENAVRVAKEKYNWQIEEKKLLAIYQNL
jgi:glycosyltransferase involved in cell wall biosynthesis